MVSNRVSYPRHYPFDRCEHIRFCFNFGEHWSLVPVHEGNRRACTSAPKNYPKIIIFICVLRVWTWKRSGTRTACLHAHENDKSIFSRVFLRTAMNGRCKRYSENEPIAIESERVVCLHLERTFCQKSKRNVLFLFINYFTPVHMACMRSDILLLFETCGTRITWLFGQQLRIYCYCERVPRIVEIVCAHMCSALQLRSLHEMENVSTSAFNLSTRRGVTQIPLCIDVFAAKY